MSTSLLAEIVAYKRQWVQTCRQRVSEAALIRAAKARTPLDFAGVLEKRVMDKQTAVIAEVKKASPSKGLIREAFDAVGIAKAYTAGGAACISVLTDKKYFQGSDEDLKNVRAAVELPILRKDFMLDTYQVIEAAGLGADCILIIMAMVDDALARDLCAAASQYGLSVLPEAHDSAELERALKLDTKLIGINNRDLHSFDTSLTTTLDLLPQVPADHIIITESGIHRREDIERLQAAGVFGFLVGEHLMRESDPGEALRQLLIS